MRNVIVTGGAGFIGGWLIQELLNNNICVTAVVRDKSKLLADSIQNLMLVIIEKSVSEIDEKDFEEK